VIWARRFACRGILHFSYATLTTVGFGDVLPTTVAGRTLDDDPARAQLLRSIPGVGFLLTDQPQRPAKGEE
jgi:ion channel